MLPRPVRRTSSGSRSRSPRSVALGSSLVPRSSPRRSGRLRSNARLASLALVSTALLTGYLEPVRPAPSGDGVTDARWIRVFTDHFRGDAIDESKWAVFNGPGPRTRENVIVRNGKLILRTQKVGGEWLAAGVGSSRAVVQRYGKYEARLKLQPGRGTRGVALLWPSNGTWPPEVDFYEIGGMEARRRTNWITNHYQPGNQMIHRRVDRNFSKWQDVGVEWTPDSLKFTLNGRVVRTIEEHVPQLWMWFGLQSGLEEGEYAPGPRTPKHVDFKAKWVRVWRMA